MSTYDVDWEATFQRQRSEMAEMDTVLARWRAEVFAKIDDFEAREVADRRELQFSSREDDETLADAPPGYERVQQMIERGELQWFDVLAGDSEDPDVRAVHVWADSRLEAVRRAFASINEGMTETEALAAIQSTLDQATDPAGQSSQERGE